MSVVTNILILHFDDEQAAIDFINRELEITPGPNGRFIDIHDHCVGKKGMEAHVTAAGVNYLDLEWFKRLLHRAPWKHRYTVQVLAREQEDETWSMIFASCTMLDEREWKV